MTADFRPLKRLGAAIVSLAFVLYFCPILAQETVAAEERLLDERQISLEERRLELERQRVEGELALKEAELSIRQAQLEAAGDFQWSSPLVVAIFGATIALIGNALVALINGLTGVRQTAEKSRSDMVLQALKSDDVEKVKKNLLLLAKTRLLREPKTSEAIVKFVEDLDPGEGPGLAAETAGTAVEHSSLKGDMITFFSQKRREEAFTRARAAGLLPVLAWGDSWLQYPFILKDIADYLSKEYAIRSRAHPLMSVADLLSKKVKLKPGAYCAVILSAGLRDFLQDWSGMELGGESANGIASKLSGLAKRLVGDLRKVVAHLKAQDPDLLVVMHGYDYFRPGQGGLGQKINRNGISQDLLATGVHEFIDSFNEGLLSEFSQDSNVFICDFRGMLIDNDWHDEFHPNNDGFYKLAQKISAALAERVLS